jgi:glutamate-1-semialdehyde 2,1-aminomutase
MNISKSESLFRQAQKLLVGGVNSPVRAFKAVGGTPLYFVRGEGAYLYDADGNKYLDFLAGWGPLLLGHCHPAVVKALQEAVLRGTTFGTPTPEELEWARLIQEAYPNIELMRMVNSGTEATMTALRLARAYTGRKYILKFEGCYHGHSDGLLAKAGSGALTFGLPDSLGVPEEVVQFTLTLPYNNKEAVQDLFQKRGESIAAVIIEPVAANMGVVLPDIEWLKLLHNLTRAYEVTLIFDEVITGFRLAWGGAQEYFGITADLVCLGKIIGGGLPVGCLGGRAEIMQRLAPCGGVYQAGTLAGNLLAASAGAAVLNAIKAEQDFYPKLNAKANYFLAGLQAILNELKISSCLNHIGSIFTLFFTPAPVSDYLSARQADAVKYAQFFHKLLEQGIYWAPSAYEANFISWAHRREDLDWALERLEKIFTL